MPEKFIKNSVIVDMDEEEASRLRQAWVQHIFTSIEKLTAEVYSGKEATNNKFNKINEEFYKIREEYKVYVGVLTDKIKDTHKNDLTALSVEMRALNDAFSTYKLKCLENAKTDSEAVDGKISDLKDHVENKLSPVSKEVWVAKGKVAAMAALAGAVAAAIITLSIRQLF